MLERIRKIISDSIAVKGLVAEANCADIGKAAGLIINALKAGGKVVTFGNGGSAADSQHMAAELVGRFQKERAPLAAIALTTNTSSITAIANDYGYGATFKRQIEALGKRGDVAIAISTSGNAENVIGAVKACKGLGIETVALTGKDGGKLAPLCDVSIVVPSGETARIQESHLMIGHILCCLAEEACSE